MKIDLAAYIANWKADHQVSQIPEDRQRDNMLRVVLTRIKYARIHSSQRDELTRIVRNLAVDDRLDLKTSKDILHAVALSESLGGASRNSDKNLPRKTKTVDQEVAEINSRRQEKSRRQNELDHLKTLFSARA